MKGDGTPDSRKPRNREATTAAILQAATRCFAQVGYEAATTRSIAERAGVSEGLIHRYFGSKEGLLIAIMRGFLEQSASAPALEPVSGNLENAVTEFLEASCRHHEPLVDAMRVLVSRAIIDPDVGRLMGRDLEERHVPELAGALARAGVSRPDEPAFILSAFSFVLGFMAPHVFYLDPEELRKVARWIARAVARDRED